MKRNKHIVTVLILTISLGLFSCLNHANNKIKSDKIITNSSSSSNQERQSTKTDSLSTHKEKLTNIYTQAIGEFIKAVYYNDKTTFDTLYFGKHIYGQPDDFPDIELPTTIENTQIRLISPEIGQKKQAERKSLVYVNLMGWVDKKKAEFIFVVFKNGGIHQNDYSINYKHNISKDKFELEKIEFENYLNLNGQKPKRKHLYIDGKYNENN
ncbi:MAG: hypothetical protein EBT39_01075 [Sphingobacteriia bacterium]|nr:hypothetical protein [Candidatus Fonsibacter lacus]